MAIHDLSSPRTLDEELHPVQLQILQNMSESERVALWNDMTRATLEMSFLNLQESYPEATHRELMYRFASLLYGEQLASEAYGKPW